MQAASIYDLLHGSFSRPVVPGEFRPCLSRIMIYFPVTGKQKLIPVITDKIPDILDRIFEKNAQFVREFSAAGQICGLFAF